MICFCMQCLQKTLENIQCFSVFALTQLLLWLSFNPFFFWSMSFYLWRWVYCWLVLIGLITNEVESMWIQSDGTFSWQQIKTTTLPHFLVEEHLLLARWRVQQQCHNFVCALDIFLFCSTRTHKLYCYDHGNLLVWGFTPSWADVFHRQRINSSHHHTQTQTPELSSYFSSYICLACYDLPLQLTDVAAAPLNWISATLLPNRWQ